MPDKEKIITPENQGKGVTPTAGSKQLITPTVNRPMATPQITKQPKPEKQMVDKAGNPVAPPYDPTGKSFSEINDYVKSQYANRQDSTATTDFGIDPYKTYSSLGDEAAFYQGEDFARKASEEQSGWQQARNAVVGGTLNGVLKGIEGLTYLPNILTRDWEKTALQKDLAAAQADVNQALPVYSDPNNPLSMDSSMFWGGVKGVIESGLQFAIPGKAISSGLGVAGKLLSTGARAALAAEGTAGTILESMATKVSTKAGALMEGMIAEPAKRAALVEWAKSVPAGLIQNQLEGTIMGMEVYDQKVAELRAAGETDEAYIKKEASAVADQLRNQNMLMIVKDMWEMKTIFGKPTKGAQILTDESRYFPKPSEMMIWKKDVWKAAWNGSKNPFMLSMGEAGEEMFQGGLEDNIMNQSRIRENKDHEGNENFTKLAVDKDKADGGPLAVLGYAFTDQNIFEGMMGFFGGGFQNAIGNIPGKVADNKNYKRLNTQLTAINEQIEAEPIEENKEILRNQAAQIKAEIGNTLKGHYEAQQAQVSENQELLKNKFDNLLDAHEIYEKAVFENDTVTQQLIKDNLFAKAAMDNLKKGTLANFRESIQEIADGTPQAANLVDEEVTPESRAKAKEMLERLTDIETSWNRHKDTQLGERKFFVGENKKIIKRGFENVNKKSETVKTRINDEIAEYNKAQKIINPDHVDLGSIDEISEGKINPIGLSEADQIVYRNLTDRKKKLSEDPLSMNSHDLRQLDKFIIREEELKTLDKTNKEKAAEFLNDPELQAVRDQTEMLDRAEKKNTEEETYLNSAQYRYWKDRINTFISKNAEKITSNKLEELADEIKGAVKDVNSKTRFDGVGKKDASSKKAINTAARNDLLGQVRKLQFKLHELEEIKNNETLVNCRTELAKQKETLILGPFMNEAVRGNGYFKWEDSNGNINYAYINSASVDDDAIIQYTVNGRTEDEVPYLSELDEEGKIVKTGFKDSFMRGFVEASTEQEYVAKLMEMLKSMHTEVPVEEEFEEEEFEETEEDGSIGGFLPGSTSPMKAPVFEWDIEPIVNIETKPKPKNVSKKPKGNIAVDQEIEPVENITIPPVEPTIIIEDEWEKNKLFTPSTTVSYLSRQYVKSANGRVKNKNNTRTLKPIDTQEYLVDDPAYFRITDGNYDTHDIPIEIIIKGDEQNVNKAYVPTIASILATDGSIPGLFSEEDPTKSDNENKYMILNDRGLEVLAAIQAYISDPNKANGNSYNKISTLIAAPFKNNKDKNPFTRMLTAKKEDKTVIRDFNMATDELINLYQNRSRVIADINAGITRPRTKIKSINSGGPARLVSNETETTPNTNLVRVSKFLKDTGVQVRQYESKKKGKFNVLSLPMKRSTLEDSVTMGVLVKVDNVDHDLVYAFIEDYLTRGPITRKLDSQAAMKLLNTVWGQEYENSDTKLPIADHIDLSEDKSTGERQIVFKHKNKKPTKNDFVKPDALIDNKLTESIKSAISAYIVDAKMNVLKINTNSKVDIETIKLNKGVLQKVVKSPLAMFADNSATDILATKAPNGEWIFHEQATFNLDYGLQMGDSIVDNSDFDAAMNAEADIKAIEESSEYKEGEAEWLREKHDAPLRLDPGAAINIIEDIARRRQEELNTLLTKLRIGDYSSEIIIDSAKVNVRILNSSGFRNIDINEEVTKFNSKEEAFKFVTDHLPDTAYKLIATKNSSSIVSKKEINAKYDAELAALNNLTNTDTSATEEKSKPVPDDDFSIATEDYESIIVDDDKNKALLDTYTIDYPGMTDSLKDDLVNDFAARIMTRFNGTAKSAPIKNIGDNLASVKKYYFEKYIPNQTNPILKDMPSYYNKLESLAFAKVQAMGLKITGKQVGNLAIDEMEALDFSGENGRAVERYDTSIFDIDDRDRASFRLKSKLALIRDGETQMGFDRYLDPENTYGLIRQLLANKPYMTVGEAVKFLREQKNQSRVLNLVADDIEKWDMSAKNELRTVFNLHKNKTGIMLWNSKNGEYSANIIDANRVSGGRMIVSKWQAAFMDMVNDPNNNMVINSESEPYLINADKVNKIKEDYIELTNQYYEFEEVYGEVPNSAVYAEQIAGLLNQLGIDVVTDEIKSIIDYPYEYAKIAEGWERNNMSHVFNNKSGVIGVLFSNIGNIPSTKTELIGEDPETAINYVSMEKYNPFTEGGNYLSNLGKFISYKRGNIDSESAYSANGNIKFAYTIPNPLSNVVDRIKSGNYDIENASSFAQRSELVNDPSYDVELMDALKEETEGIFEESNKLKPAELESEELGGIQNNGNKRRFAQIPTNSDKSLFAKTSLSANRESNTFLEDQIANNSAYFVKSVEIESERMRQFNGLSTGIADSKTIDGLTGNTKYDNGYKYFYLLPTANIQIAKAKLKEQIVSLVDITALDDSTSFEAEIKNILPTYSKRYFSGYDSDSEESFYKQFMNNQEEHAKVLNQPDLAHLVMMASGETNASATKWNMTIDEFVEKIIDNNYEKTNPIYLDNGKIKFDTAIPKNDFGFVSMLAANKFNEELKNKLDLWNKYEIGIKRMDSQWKAKVIGNGKNVFSEKLNALVTFTDAQIVEIAAREMIYYSTFASLEYYQLVAGDPASFYKGPSNKLLSDSTAEEVNNFIHATNVDAVKRNAKNLAAGTLPSFDILRYDEKTDTFTPETQKTYHSAAILDNYRASINKDIMANERLAGMYGTDGKGRGKINVADALEYSSFEEHLHVMFAKGTQDLTMDMYKSMLPKARYQDRLKWNQKVPDQYKLTDEELKFVFGMMKPVQVSNVQFKSNGVGGANYATQVEVYIKSSSMPIIHQLFQGLEVAKLKQGMFYEGDVLRETPIDRLAYESAYKGGALRIANVWDAKGNITNIDALYPVELPREGFFIQQEIPYDELKNKILIMSQMDKLFTEGYAQHDKTDVLGRKAEVKKAMFREAKADFLKRFGAKLQEDGETYEFQDLNKVVELLKKEAFSRGFSKNVIDQLRIVDGKLDPMFFNIASQKYESVLASLVSGIILQKVHGHSYVQTSASGVITPDQIPDDFKRDIVTVPGHNMSMDLPFITKKDGKIEPAGVYVPFQFLSNKGKEGVQNKLNVKDYTITDETGTYLDMSKIDPSLLNLIGGRIPGQGPNSMLPIKILGFLPEYMGNTIVVPAEISVQMGSDFDVDKLYTYMWNYVVNSKTGQISKYDPNPKAIYKARKALTDPFTLRIDELKKRRTDELTRLVGEGVLEQVSVIKQLRQDTTDSIKEYEDAIQSYWGTEITADDQVEIDRNLYELKQLDQRVKDIDSDLKLIGEEKRKFANTTEGKAIQQELDQLYSELNEATKDFDPTKIVGQDIKSLQNQYFDLHWEVLTDENMFERIAESLDMDDLRLEFEKRNSKNEAAGLISPKFNRDTYLENRAGKQGVATEANGIVMNAMIQNKGITLLQEGQDLSIKIKSKGKVLNLDILGNDARSQYDNEDRRIHKNLQNIQSESVDNAKNGRLGALNLNEDTFNAANALLMLSDSSKGGYQEGGTPGIGSVANDHVVALVEQDIIHEFIESKAASFNQFSKAKFSRYAEGKLKSSIIEKYYKLIHQKADEYIKIPSHMELIKNIVIPGVNELNSAKKLDLDSATPEQLDKYYRVQLNAFLGFLALDEVGQIVAGTQKAIDGSTKGIGKSFIESLMKERMFKDRIQDGNYESSYFGIKLNNVQSLEDSEYGVAMKEGVIFANNLFGKMFPYRNLFNKVTDYFKGQNKSLDEKDYRNIFNFYKTYIFANNDIYSSGDVVAERARLKEGDDNIFDRLKKYQAENTSGDYLLKGIVVEYDKVNKERRLKYSAGKSQRQDEYLNTVSLLKMLNSNDEELRRFGNDLITYSFLTNPIQSANNFMMYIPASVQQSNVVSAYLNKATMDMMDDNIKYADFMEQFIRHNPSFAPKKVMRRSYTSTIELQNYNTYLDKILQLQSELKKPGLSDEEKTSIGNEIARNSAMKNAWFSSTSNPIYTELDEDREPNKFNYITFADPQNEVNGEFDTTMLFKTNKDPKTGQYILSAIPLLGTYESRNMNSSTGFVDTSSVNSYELGNEEMANRLIPESETDLTDALENIKTYGNSNQTEIADILRQIVSPTAKISVDTEARNPGRYIASEDKIVINPNLDNKFNSKSNREDIISGIIHESWHSVFNPIVARYMEDPNSVTEAQRISIKRLDILRKDALKAARKNNKKELTEFLGNYMNLLKQDEAKNANKILSLQDTINFVLESPNNKSINTTTSGITPQMKAKYYGLVNVQEFVTMAWSDNNFQTVLNEIKASKPEVKSFLERIVEAFEGLFRTILESFGITVNPENVLAHTLAESYNVVSDNKEVELNKTSTIWASKIQDKVIYSGDATGSDREFKKVGKQFGIRTVDYTPQTYDKLTPVQSEEVEQAYIRAVNYLGRQVISLDNEDKGKRYSAKLVRRNYLQAKAGDSVYAIIEGFETVFDKTKQGMKVIGQKTFKVIPKGGTAYAMIMADDMGKPVYAFDQSRQEWYKYTKGTITKIDIPVLSERFAGVGTRNINEAGQQAIVDLFENTYPEQTTTEETSESIKTQASDIFNELEIKKC